jgi:hypothetical protein
VESLFIRRKILVEVATTSERVQVRLTLADIAILLAQPDLIEVVLVLFYLFLGLASFFRADQQSARPDVKMPWCFLIGWSASQFGHGRGFLWKEPHKVFELEQGQLEVYQSEVVAFGASQEAFELQQLLSSVLAEPRHNILQSYEFSAFDEDRVLFVVLVRAKAVNCILNFSARFCPIPTQVVPLALY